MIIPARHKNYPSRLLWAAGTFLCVFLILCTDRTKNYRCVLSLHIVLNQMVFRKSLWKLIKYEVLLTVTIFFLVPTRGLLSLYKIWLLSGSKCIFLFLVSLANPYFTTTMAWHCWYDRMVEYRQNSMVPISSCIIIMRPTWKYHLIGDMTPQI